MIDARVTAIVLVGLASALLPRDVVLQVPAHLQGARPSLRGRDVRRGGRRARRAHAAGLHDPRAALQGGRGRCRRSSSGLEGLNYPKTQLDVLLLCEEDDEETILAIEAMDLPPHFRLIVVPDAQPKTKPKACNYGLMLARGDITVIFDAEDRPDPDQLKKVVVAFSKSSARGHLRAGQAQLLQPRPEPAHALVHDRSTRCGSSCCCRAWTPTARRSRSAAPPTTSSPSACASSAPGIPYNVTEDADLGIRLHKAGYRTAMVDSTTLEEANSDLKQLDPPALALDQGLHPDLPRAHAQPAAAAAARPASRASCPSSSSSAARSSSC